MIEQTPPARTTHICCVTGLHRGQPNRKIVYRYPRNYIVYIADTGFMVDRNSIREFRDILASALAALDDELSNVPQNSEHPTHEKTTE